MNAALILEVTSLKRRPKVIQNVLWGPSEGLFGTQIDANVAPKHALKSPLEDSLVPKPRQKRLHRCLSESSGVFFGAQTFHHRKV